jgi:hypothetical protein
MPNAMSDDGANLSTYYIDIEHITMSRQEERKMEELLADGVCNNKSCCKGDSNQNDVIDVDIITDNKRSTSATVDATWPVILLAAKERSRQGQEESGLDWTKEEESVLIEQLKQHSNNASGRYNSIRYDWDQIAMHPALEGRTRNQLKWKWKRIQTRQRGRKKHFSAMASGITNRDRSGRSFDCYENKPKEAYKQTSIKNRNASRNQHRRQTWNWWTKEEEQPLIDLLKQSYTGRIDWKDIAKLPVLAGRTAQQVKHKWQCLKARGPNARGISCAIWSAEEDTRVLELYESTDAESVVQKSMRVAGAFPGRTQTAVQRRYYTLSKHAAEAAKKGLAVSKPALASVETVQTTQCCATRVAGIHGEENTHQLDNKGFPGKLMGRSERARSCGDCEDIGSSEQRGPNSEVEDTVSLATKRRPHIMMHGNNQSSVHKAGPVAVASFSTLTSGNSSPTQLKRRCLDVLPSLIIRPVLQEVEKPISTLWIAPTNDTNWACLSPKKNADVFNDIVSWPLFDGFA